MSNNLKAGIRFTPDIYAEIGYDSQNETGEMSVIGANGETIWESGGGGGSSDFSTAQVTIVGEYPESETLNVPSIIEVGMLDFPIPTILTTSPRGATVFTVPLYKGHVMMMGIDYVVSGNIVKHVEDGWIWYDITGDCTITIS